MRRSIVHEGAGQLTYEIREIVAVAKKMEAAGLKVTWENIGDPIQKGEPFPHWMKEIPWRAGGLKTRAYAYSDTQGIRTTRQFLADLVNARNGCQITADDILFFKRSGRRGRQSLRVSQKGSPGSLVLRRRTRPCLPPRPLTRVMNI